MTKIGIITDAHANHPALSAALQALDEAGCDLIVHTGDAIGIGPHPAEVLEILLSRPHAHLLMGNHDEYFVHGLPDQPVAWMSSEELEHQYWTHSQVDVAMRDVVASWPYSLELVFAGATTAFCHYPRGHGGSGFASIITDPRAEDLDRLFSPSSADIVFYGHHHPRSDLRGRTRYVNPGSLGCNTLPQARFAILEIEDDGRMELRLASVPYSPESLFQDFERRGVPARQTIIRVFFGQHR